MKIAQVTNALSFYRSKTILDPSKLFWTGPNVLDTVQNVKFSSEKLFLVLSKTFWTYSNQFGHIQNNLDLIEGQGISLQYLLDKEKQKNILTDRKISFFFV